jgi:glycosyltransferase involved in cell wall biosynthesis
MDCANTWGREQSRELKAFRRRDSAGTPFLREDQVTIRRREIHEGEFMSSGKKPVRVLYSFPNKLGADRICYTAWQQVNWVAAAGAEVTVFAGGVVRPLNPGVKAFTTLARGRLRLPYKLLGSKRTLALHDYIVAGRLRNVADQFDVIHTWPSGALRTLKAAAELGIPTVLERPNAHTRFAIEVVKQECERLGLTMPPGHEHAENPEKVRLEEEEFALADRLLCPSDFVARTFFDKGFPQEKLARHQYGYDESAYFPAQTARPASQGLTMLFVGGCAPRKGVHYALEAWLQSPASRDGKFLIAGAFIPGYAEKLAGMLSHPSVTMLGHRKDVPELMRNSDILVLPTIEEGSALVTSEARGSGCVLLVSEAAGAICKHMEDSLVHRVGDVAALTRHITMLHEDRALLARLRTTSLNTLSELTWKTAGIRLLDAYRETIEMYEQKTGREAAASSVGREHDSLSHSHT